MAKSELSAIQKKTLEFFAKSSLKDKFYWTGGTLLAYMYLHHRRSNDLDFFSDEPFGYGQIIGFVKELKRALRLSKIEEKKIFDRWDFILHSKQKLRIEFVHYAYPKIKARKRWRGIFIDSLDDIAANKLMAHFDRNDPKDLFDLYFILTQKGYTIEKLTRLVKEKFGVTLDKAAVLSESYKSMKDLDELTPLIIASDTKQKRRLVKDIQNYFKELSGQHLHRIL